MYISNLFLNKNILQLYKTLSNTIYYFIFSKTPTIKTQIYKNLLTKTTTI